jgi:hypothetical protein
MPVHYVRSFGGSYSGAGRPHVITYISPNCDIKHISVTIWGMISLSYSYGRLDVTGEVAV